MQYIRAVFGDPSAIAGDIFRSFHPLPTYSCTYTYFTLRPPLLPHKTILFSIQTCLRKTDGGTNNEVIHGYVRAIVLYGLLERIELKGLGDLPFYYLSIYRLR